MSIVNILTRKSPTINGFEFDAVLTDTLTYSVTVTGYTTETGVRINDHRVINPTTWQLTGAVSNIPLSVSVTDFTGALVQSDNGLLATAAGTSAGLLSGSDDTRASTTLDYLVDLMQTGSPFDIDTGDKQLKNMVIVNITREKNPENEDGLIFVAELQEWISLDTLGTYYQPSTTTMSDSDQIQSMGAADSNIGPVTGSTPSASSLSSIGSIA